MLCQCSLVERRLISVRQVLQFSLCRGGQRGSLGGKPGPLRTVEEAKTSSCLFEKACV